MFLLYSTNQKMTNLYYDLLPDDIQEYIHGIRLSDALTRHRNMHVAQKKAIAKIIYLNLPVYAFESGVVYDPYDPNVARIVDKCSKILTKHDDYKGFWLPYFIRAIERGLIEYKYRDGSNSHIYDKTEYACDRFLERFGYRKNSLRLSSVS